ncbi:MAG: hypothetical protein PHG85_01645 [Candidatus Altiarchaeota archaeon]|nr:hypothetical protein [Candidatus Altiarchaeota archaeon]
MDSEKILERLGLSPKYDELMLYSMSLAFLLLWVYDADMRSSIVSLASEDVRMIGVLFFVLCGIFYSIINVFRTKPADEQEKKVMLFFAVLVTCFMSLYAAARMMENSEGLWIVLPLWNISYSVILFFLLKSETITVDDISDRQASRLEAVVSTLATLVVFAVSHFVLQYYWAITYSLCITYSAHINDRLVKALIPTKSITKQI